MASGAGACVARVSCFIARIVVFASDAVSESLASACRALQTNIRSFMHDSECDRGEVSHARSHGHVYFIKLSIEPVKWRICGVYRGYGSKKP